MEPKYTDKIDCAHTCKKWNNLLSVADHNITSLDSSFVSIDFASHLIALSCFI